MLPWCLHDKHAALVSNRPDVEGLSERIAASAQLTRMIE
jgi:hypothetical protein